MADVTITGLPRGTPLGKCFVPVSDGVVTVKSPISALQVDFSNITGQPNSMPTGGIILWSGAAAAIPTGWVLCNGLNGTPNLVDKFVLGASTSTPAVGTTGGSKDAIVVSHTHTATDSGHTHTYTFAGARNQAAVGSGATTFTSTQTTSVGTANITVAAAGAAGTNANLPPYYALCYIMKT